VSPNRQPAESETHWILNELVGEFVFFIWWVRFKIKVHIAPYLPWVVAALVIFETLTLSVEVMDVLFRAGHVHGEPAVSSVVHGLDLKIHAVGKWLGLGPWKLLSLAMVPVILGGITVWHHSKVIKRLDERGLLLDALREIMAAAFGHQAISTDESITRAMEILTVTLLAIKKDSLPPWRKAWQTSQLRRDATILKLKAGADHFTPLHQWPSHPNPPYQEDGKIPLGSAAGVALEKAKDQELQGAPYREFKGIVYIPWTRCSNGARLKMPQYRRFELLARCYVHLNLGDEPRSLICLEIPIHINTDDRYVLCLDSNKRMCFEDIDYHAIHLVANVIGSLLTEDLLGLRK
jgi:hypothetical protein